jgi:hypothetical protein
VHGLRARTAVSAWRPGAVCSLQWLLSRCLRDRFVDARMQRQRLTPCLHLQVLTARGAGELPPVRAPAMAALPLIAGLPPLRKQPMIARGGGGGVRGGGGGDDDDDDDDDDEKVGGVGGGGSGDMALYAVFRGDHQPLGGRKDTPLIQGKRVMPPPPPPTTLPAADSTAASVASEPSHSQQSRPLEIPLDPIYDSLVLDMESSAAQRRELVAMPPAASAVSDQVGLCFCFFFVFFFGSLLTPKANLAFQRPYVPLDLATNKIRGMIRDMMSMKVF